MNEYVKEVPDLLARLRIKEKAASAWIDLHNPIKVSDDPKIFLTFTPNEIAYTGFSVENGAIKTTFTLKGETIAASGYMYEKVEVSSLPDLRKTSLKDGWFSFTLPILITFDEILSTALNKYPYGDTITRTNSPVDGNLKIANLKLNKTPDGALSVTADVNYDNRLKWLKAIDIFDWFDIEGSLTFVGRPRIDITNRILSIDELTYESSTNNKLFDALVDVAGVSLVESFLSNKIKYYYGPKLDASVAKANERLHISNSNGIKISASLRQVTIGELSINGNGLELTTNLSGDVDASLGF